MPSFFHLKHHLGAEIHQRVVRRQRIVTALRPDLIAEILGFRRPGVPEALDRVDFLEAGLVGVRVADIVEHEELGLGSEIRGVGDAGGFQIRLGAMGDAARIAAIALIGDRVVDIADDVQRLDGKKGIDLGGRGIGHHEHIALVDRLEPRMLEPSKPTPSVEGILIDVINALRSMLPGAQHIDEPEVDEIDSLFLGEFQDVSRGLGHGPRSFIRYNAYSGAPS